MFASRAITTALVAVAAVVMGACAPEPHSALEPLRGPDDEISVGLSEAGPEQDPVTFDDLPEDMFADAPQGFGDVPLDEMELPADDAPPPIEGGAPPPPPPAVASPAPEAPADPPATNPAPNTPLPSGGAGGVQAAGDYCELFREYQTVMAAVDSALASGSPQQITAAMQLAAQVHDRAAELEPSIGADHRAVAGGMRALQDLLAAHAYDIGALVLAVDSDPSVAARFEAASVDHELDRTVQHVEGRCGVSLI